ncbi:MAG: hypothetical protein AAB346_05315, partial [Pseudomonadota bacterium]
MKLSWYVTALGAAIVWGVHYPLLDHALKRLSLFTVLFLTVLPMLLEQCVERLARVDPSPLFGTGPSAPCAVLVNYAWVDRDLRPVSGRARVEALGGAGLDDAAPLAERLGKLAPLTLLVEVATGEGRT